MFNSQVELGLRLSKGAVQSVIAEIKAGLDQADLSVGVRTNNNRARATSQPSSGGSSQSASSGAASFAGATAASNQAAAATGRLSTAVADTSKNFSAATKSAGAFGDSIVLATRRFTAFSLGAGALVTVVSAFRAATAEAISFDLQINKLRQVAGDGSGAVKSLRSEIQLLAKTTGVSSGELAEAATTFVQAGLSASDSAKAVRAFALAMNAPNFQGATQTAEGAVAIYQQFGKSADNLKGQLGSLNAVAGAFAVEAGDLVTAVQKAGGSFSSAGGNLNELLALMTAVRSTTRESADQIGTGLRSIFSYVQRPQTVENLKELGIQLRYTAEEAKSLGKTDLTDQFVGPYEAVKRLSEGLNKLRTTDPRYAAAIEDLGGIRQVSRVIPLVQQFAEAQKALNVAKVGGSSLDSANLIRQDALITKLAKVREEYQALVTELADSKGFKTFADSMLSLASAAAQLLPALTPLIPVLAAVATVGAVRSLGNFGASRVRKNAGFARGGPVPADAGVTGQDSVPAVLMPGEYVLNRQATEAIGLKKLNDWNFAKRFASGGAVGGRSPNRKDEAIAKFAASIDASSTFATPGPTQKFSLPRVAPGANEKLEAGIDVPGITDFKLYYEKAKQKVKELFGDIEGAFEELSLISYASAERAKAKARNPNDSKRVANAARTLGDVGVDNAALEGLVNGIGKFDPNAKNADGRQTNSFANLKSFVSRGATGRITENSLTKSRSQGVRAAGGGRFDKQIGGVGDNPRGSLTRDGEGKADDRLSVRTDKSGRGITVLDSSSSLIDDEDEFLSDSLREDKAAVAAKEAREAAREAEVQARLSRAKSASSSSTQERLRKLRERNSAVADSKAIEEEAARKPNVRPREKFVDESRLSLRKLRERADQFGSRFRSNFPIPGQTQREFDEELAESKRPKKQSLPLADSKLSIPVHTIAGEPSRLPFRKPPKKVGYRKGASEAEKQLARTGVLIDKGIDIPDEEINLIRAQAEKVPKSVRKILGDLGSFGSLSDKNPYQSTLGKNYVSKASADATTERIGQQPAGFAVVHRGGEGSQKRHLGPYGSVYRADYARQQAARDESGGLVHERVHELDAAGAVYGSFLSSRPEFAGPGKDLQQHFSNYGKTGTPASGPAGEYAASDLMESFAEGARIYLEGGAFTNSLPEAAKKYFTSLFTSIENAGLEALRPGALVEAAPTGETASEPAKTGSAKKARPTPRLDQLNRFIALGGDPSEIKSKDTASSIKAKADALEQGQKAEPAGPKKPNPPSKNFSNESISARERGGYDGSTSLAISGGLDEGVGAREARSRLYPDGFKAEEAKRRPKNGLRILSPEEIAQYSRDAEAKRAYEAGEFYGNAPQEPVLGRRKGTPKRDSRTSEQRIIDESLGLFSDEAGIRADAYRKSVLQNGPPTSTQAAILEEVEARRRAIDPKQPLPKYAEQSKEDAFFLTRNPDPVRELGLTPEEFEEQQRRKGISLKPKPFSADSLSAIASARTAGDISKRGLGGNSLLGGLLKGPDGDSPGSGILAATQERRLTEAREQLVRGIYRQLGALDKNLSSTDKLAAANELAADATRKVALDKNGQIVGDAGLGEALNKDGRDIGGRGRLGRFADRLGSQDGVRGRIGRLGSGLLRGASNASGNTAVLGAVATSVALPYLSEAIRPGDGAAARVAGGQGSQSAFENRSAAAGALQQGAIGATIGATIGSAAGPIGTALGAAFGGAIGAVNGFRSGLEEAAEAIRNAKVDKSLTRLGDQLNRASDGKTSFSSLNQTSLIRDIDTLRSDAAAKAKEQTTGTFTTDPEKAFARDQAAYLERFKNGEELGEAPTNARVEATSAAFKASASGQASAFANALTKASQEAGAANPLGDGAKSSREIAEGLSTGLSGQLLRITAELREVSLAEALGDLTKDVEDFRRNAKVLKDLETQKVENERQALSLGRLADAAETSSFSANSRASAGLLGSEAFGGRRAYQVSGLAEGFGLLGARDQSPFQRSLALADNAAGGNSPIARQGNALAEVSRVLPGILEAAKAAGLDPKNTESTVIANLLKEALPVGGRSAETSAIIQSVLATFNKEDSARKDGTAGPRASAQDEAIKLLGESGESFKREGSRFGAANQQQLNQFASGLDEARRQSEQIEAGRDKASESGLSATRAIAEARQVSLGGAGAGPVSLRDLLAPGESAQSRLLSGTNLANDDASGIARRLAQRTSERERLNPQLDAATADPAKFAELSRQYDAIGTEADNLAKALANLADPVRKQQALQEKLNEALSERDARTGYAERFLNASPEERAKLNRGQSLVRSLDANPERFGSLSDDDRRLALQGARGVGAARLASGRTGEGLAGTLLQQLLPSAGKFQKQAEGLVGEKAEVAGLAEKAQNLLVKGLETENNKFLSGLEARLRAFLDGLAIDKQSSEVDGLKGQREQAGQVVGKLRTQQEAARTLRVGGINNDTQLKAARASTEQIKSFFKAKDEFDTANSSKVPSSLAQDLRKDSSLREKAFGKSVGFVGNKEQFKFDPKAAEELLKKYGVDLGGSTAGAAELTPDKTRGIVERRKAEAEAAKGGALSSGEGQKVLADSFAEAAQNAANAAVADKVVAARGNLRKASGALGEGVDVGNLQGIPKESRQKFLDALGTDTFTDKNNPLANLPKNAADASNNLGRLNVALEAATRRLDALAGEAAARREAERTGAPRPGLNEPLSIGNDRVPALLTQGEFVVPRGPAAANQELLEAISNGKRPEYLAVGGLAGATNALASSLAEPGYRARYEEEKRRKRSLRLGAFADPYGEAGLIQQGNNADSFASQVGLRGREYRQFRVAKALEASSRRELSSLRLRQAFARSAGEDDQEQYSGAIGRTDAREVGNRVRFDNSYGGEISSYLKDTQRAREEARLRENARILANRQRTRIDGGNRAQPVSRPTGGYFDSTSAFPTFYGPSSSPSATNPTRPGVPERRRTPTNGEGSGVFNRGTQLEIDRRRDRSIQLPFQLPGFARGGLIPGNSSLDDTQILAQGGEFVMNRLAVNAVGVGALNKLNRFATGGSVGGNSGGNNSGTGSFSSLDPSFAPAVKQFVDQSQELAKALGGFSSPAGALASALGGFGPAVDRLAKAIEAFPKTVEHSGTFQHTVILNGTEAFTAINESFTKYVDTAIKKQLESAFARALPDAPRPTA